MTIIAPRWIEKNPFRFRLKTCFHSSGSENATTYPHPGEVLWYPGGVSETELLIAYGRTHFASKAGSLAGNHFLTITDGLDQLPEIGRHVLWHGAQPLRIEVAR